MAYNTWKGDAAVGDVVNQDDIDTLIDWEDDYISLKTDGTARLTVSGSNIGIGTTGPDALVHVYKAATSQKHTPDELLRLEQKDEGVDMSAGHGPALTFYVGETDGSDHGGSIAVVREAEGDADSAAAMSFYTAGDDSAPTEKARITSTGKVGIGTTSPTSLLTVVGTISGSSTLETVGAVHFGSTLNVTGAVLAKANVTLGDAGTDVITVSGRLTGSQGAYFNSRVGIGTATPSDELHISASTSAVIIESYESSIAQIIFKQAGANYGRIQVGGGGAFNIENLAADEDTIFKVNDGGTTRTALTLNASDAEVVVNQGSDSLLDFRVEGDGQTHMLFVDGSADKVGIKNSAPTHELTIGGNVSGSGTLEMVGNAFLGGTLNVTGNADFDGTVTCDTSLTIDSTTISAAEIGVLDGVSAGTAAASKAVVLDGSKNIATIGTIGCGAITSTGNSSYGTLTGGAISGSGTLQAVGATTLGNTLNVSGAATLVGTVSVAQKIEHAGDTDTYIEFTTDSMEVKAGNESMIIALEGAGGDQADKVAINNGATDVDFQVKGTSALVPNLIRTDAANNRVGIGHGAGNLSGSATLSVIGSISGSSTLEAVGNTYLGGTLSVTGNADFDGTVTCDTSLTIDSTTISAAEIGVIDGVSAGTVTAGKAVIAAASTKNIATLGTVGCGAITSTGNSSYGTLTGGAISGSATLQAVGATTLGATLNVSGAATLAANLDATAISGSGTLQMVGGTTLGQSLHVSGALGAIASIGLGTAAVHATAVRQLSIADGTQPQFATANQISIGSKQSTGLASDGATLTLQTECLAQNTALDAVGTLSHRITIWHNGTEYYLYLDPV